MNCPKCKTPISEAAIAKYFASKGGSVGGKSKARTKAQAIKAAKAKWAKWRAERKNQTK